MIQLVVGLLVLLAQGFDQHLPAFVDRSIHLNHFRGLKNYQNPSAPVASIEVDPVQGAIHLAQTPQQSAKC